jgi:hypothetical protein
MKDAYEVLRQKEREVSRLKQEVEALRIAAPLVSEDGEVNSEVHAIEGGGLGMLVFRDDGPHTS